ncbi:MAG: hypothetical protein ACQCN5_01115 [Candidatus Bathyarchaeia archaeon]|jgi:hypothetical protein
MAQNQSSNACTDILGTLPFEVGFHFCLEGGNYTGITATSIHEFTEKLQTIDQNSIDFHMKRKDFQKWIQNEFCDKELPKQIDQINEEKVAKEQLRQELLSTINSYIKKWQKR